MDNPEEVKAADWTTEKRIADSESKVGVDDHKPLNGRNEDYGPDAETPSVLNYYRGGRTEAFGPGAETPRLVHY